MSDGARCHYCRKVPCACDTAPQPPPNPPSRYKGRCDVHGLRICDECQYGETDAKMLAAAEGRIAALEANLAALQQANVMARDIADQANQRADDALHQLVMTVKAADFALKSLKPISTAYRHLVEATTATAAAVAQHTAEVERRGAAKEMRRLAGQVGNQFVGTRRYSTPDLLARAAELEGA